MHRFYVPGFPDAGEAVLPRDEAQHLTKVLRLRPGERVGIFDGLGREAVARVTAVSASRASVDVLEPRAPAPESAVRVTLAQALLKGDKMERVIRDAVMLGVAAVQPVLARRTDVPFAALDSGTRQQRWERTVVSSAKQCGRAVVPPVLPYVEVEALIERSTEPVLMLVEPSAVGDPGPADLGAARPSSLTVLIGPEGGWDPAEIAFAEAHAATRLTLGRSRLRADVAGLVALSVLRYAWRDL